MIKVGSYFKRIGKWNMIVWIGNIHLIYIKIKEPDFCLEYRSLFKSSIRTFKHIPELEERVKDPLFEIELQQFITKYDLK